MAFENLEPYRDEILALRRPGPGQKTLTDLADHLFEKHKIRTTPATLSRYLKELRQLSGLPTPDPSGEEQDAIDAVAVLTEVLTEVRGRSDEQRVVIEHLAGQVAIQTKAIEELEKQVAKSATGQGGIDPSTLRSIWIRAFFFSAALVGLIATALVFMFRL